MFDMWPNDQTRTLHSYNMAFPVKCLQHEMLLVQL